MFNFDIPRYETVVNDAIALRPQIEAAADVICKKGYSNIFFIGCGGTYSHSFPLKLMLDTHSEIESESLMAAEFMAMPPRKFSEKSVCVFSTRSGNTKEIVQAAKFCKDAGATVVMYVSNIGTPACEYADYLFHSFAEDDNLAEAIYLVNLRFVARMMYNASCFPKYREFADGLGKIAPYLINGKELYEDRCKSLAERHKNTGYHMVVGCGYVWGEAYDYAMCILEEMQWIKTRPIHAAEFFHGTLELVEEGTSILLFFGEDSTRPLMDRVYDFATRFSKEVFVFDSGEVDLPLLKEHRQFAAPMVLYSITERLSCHLEHVRDHPLTTRRYYRQMEY